MVSLRLLSWFALTVTITASGCMTTVAGRTTTFTNSQVAATSTNSTVLEELKAEDSTVATSSFRGGWTMDDLQVVQHDNLQRFPLIRTCKTTKVRTADQNNKNLFD